MAENESVLKLFTFPSYGEDATNIFLPYFGRFPDGCNLQPGSEVVIVGRGLPESDGTPPTELMSENSQEFSVNLAMPPLNSEFNCALHFNPRFNENRVVRDHRPNGHWTQKVDYGGFPFRANKKFTLVIEVHSAGYKILVDGKHFCDYYHHVSPSKVTHIGIRGHVSITSLEVRFDRNLDKVDKGACLGKGVANKDVKVGQTSMVKELKTLGDSNTYGDTGDDIILPYFGQLPGGCSLQPGCKVVFMGRPFPGSNGFSINLAMPPVSSEYNCALHFNVRFDENRVVRDQRPEGHWVKKEDYGGFPFKQDEEFKIVIEVHTQGYKIYVDDTHFCDFQPRVAPSEVKYICIRGFVSVMLLKVQLDKMDPKWTSIKGQAVTQEGDQKETSVMKPD